VSQRFARQRVLELVDMIDQLGLGVFQANFVVDNRRVHVQIHILINSHREDESAMLTVERGEVCSPAA
jgi:hypothetical protein